MGNSVTSIGSYAFVGDQHLEVIALYPCVTSIGQGAFDRCDAALQISLPSNVTTIGSGAFANCKGLERVDFDCNETVTLGGSDVFTGCDALQYIVFPSLDAVLANTTGNWSGYSDKLRTQFGGKLFSATNEGGTPAYKIATEEDLRNLAEVVNFSSSNSGSGLTFRQTADIAMSSTDFIPIGNSSSRYFSGTYDGGHHVVSGLKVNTPSVYAGLFGHIFGGTIKNLALVNPSVSSSSSSSIVYLGAIVGGCESDSDYRNKLTNLYTYGTNLDIYYPGINPIYNTVTNVAHTSAINLDADISTTTPATDAANGFVYNGLSYYRQGLELALTTTATPDASYSSYNFAIDGSTVDNPFTVTADHDGKTVTLGTQNPDPMHFEQTAADVYHIHTADGWNVFCDALDDNDTYNRFSGMIVYLDDDITVTRMAGSNYHDFCGTFDGQNNTLTVSYGSTAPPPSPSNLPLPSATWTAGASRTSTSPAPSTPRP